MIQIHINIKYFVFDKKNYFQLFKMFNSKSKVINFNQEKIYFSYYKKKLL